MSPLLVVGHTSLLGADSIEEPMMTTSPNPVDVVLCGSIAVGTIPADAPYRHQVYKCGDWSSVIKSEPSALGSPRRVPSANVSACCREATVPAASHGSAQRACPRLSAGPGVELDDDGAACLIARLTGS